MPTGNFAVTQIGTTSDEGAGMFPSAIADAIVSHINGWSIFENVKYGDAGYSSYTSAYAKLRWQNNDTFYLKIWNVSDTNSRFYCYGRLFYESGAEVHGTNLIYYNSNRLSPTTNVYYARNNDSVFLGYTESSRITGGIVMFQNVENLSQQYGVLISGIGAYLQDGYNNSAQVRIAINSMPPSHSGQIIRFPAYLKTGDNTFCNLRIKDGYSFAPYIPASTVITIDGDDYITLSSNNMIKI